MYCAEMIFRVVKRRDDEQVADGINTLVEALQRNGQVLSDEWPIACARDRVQTYISIPERTSLQDRHANKWVRQARQKLLASLSPPQVRIMGREPDALDVCKCRDRSAYILLTDFLTLESPLRCANCFSPVPLYRIPHTSDCDTYEDIIFWRRNYQRCDGLQMGCTVGERFCTAQMARIDSDLSKQGLACCQRIEQVTGKPCYYYLYRYGGRSQRLERQRRCPRCGGAWLLDAPWHDKFDFRCDGCQLISNVSFSVE